MTRRQEFHGSARGAKSATSLRLIKVQSAPLNCEVPVSGLRTRITSNELFYVRTHFPVPKIRRSEWILEVNGDVQNPLRLTFHEMKNMPWRSVIAILECAGNGRSHFGVPTGELQWGHGATGTAEWTGVPLSEVLRRAGLKKEATDVIFEGADTGREPGSSTPINFARSLSLEKAKQRDIIIAFEMNGKPLPPEHGYPARVIVPGWYAMASVKWLKRIEVSARPFKGFFQSVKYVYETEEAGRVLKEPITTVRVKSLITSPLDGELLPRRKQTVQGMAWSGSGEIVRVEVSFGGDWLEAKVLPQVGKHGWFPWECDWTPDSNGTFTLMARATDEAGNVQPLEPILNRFQYGYNAIDKITVRIR